MKQITSVEFRKVYVHLSEPHEVTAHNKVIGHWYPDGAPLEADASMQHEAPSETAGNGMRPHLREGAVARPVVGIERRILDPVVTIRRRA